MNPTRAAKRAYIRAFKEASGCISCQEDDYRCLDLHHLDPEEKNPRMRLKRREGKTWAISFTELSWPDLEAELAKCIVLCANCHRKGKGG